MPKDQDPRTPAGPAKVHATLKTAQNLLEEGLYQEAIATFHRFLLKEPDQIDALIGLARCHIALKEIEAAQSFLNQARQIDPLHHDFIVTWGEVLISLERFEEAVEFLEAVAEGEEATARTFYLLGQGLEKVKRYPSALRAYEQALGLDPSMKLAAEAVKRVFAEGLKSGVLSGETRRLRDIGYKYLRGDKATLALGFFQQAADVSHHDTNMFLTMGHHLGARELYTQAIAGFKKALKRHPDNADALAGLAIAYAARGEKGVAMDAINRAIAHSPDRPDLHVYRGDLMLENRDLTEALNAYRRAEKLAPNDVGILFSLANTHAMLTQEVEAVEFYQRVVQINPAFSLAYLNLFSIQVRRHNFVEAVRHLRNFRQRNPDDVRGAVASLYLLDAMERHRQLIIAAKNEISRFGKDPDLLLNMGVGLLGVDEVEEAKKLFKEIVNDHPKNAGALNNLGVIAEREDKLDKALAYYANAMKVDPQMAEPHYNIGGLDMREEKYQEAAACYRKAIELDQYFTQAYHNLGICLRYLERHDEAKEILTRGLSLAEKYADSRLALGQSQMLLGNVEEALQTFMTLIDESPDYEEPHDLLLSMWEGYRAKEDHESAAKMLESALFLDEKSVDANLALGVTLYEAGKPKNALKLYERVLKLDSKNPHAILNMGVYKCDQEGNLTKGAELMQKAEDISPDMELAHFNMGLVQSTLGNKEAAEAEFLRSHSINPRSYETNLALSEIITERDLSRARIFWEQTALARPKSHVAWQNLGVVLHRMGQNEEALEALEHGLSLNPKHADMLFNKAVVLDELGDLTGAIENYLKARESRESEDILFNLADVAERKGDLVRAKAYYHECARRFPAYGPAKVNLARLFRQEGGLTEATDLLADAFAQDPADPVVLFNFGVTLIKAGDLSRAKIVIESCLARPDATVEDTLLHAALLLDLGEFAAVEALAAPIAGDSPSGRLATLYLGRSLIGQERWKEAIELLEPPGPSSTDPEGSSTRVLLLAQAYTGAKAPEKALELLRDARGAFPGDPDIPVHLAFCYLDQKRYEEALDLLAGYQGPLENRMLVLSGMARACFRLGSFERARDHYESVLIPQSPDPEVGFNVALTRFKLGDHEGALDTLRLLPEAADPRILVLTGLCYQRLEDPREKDAYERALALDETCVTARINLAGFLLIRGDPRAVANLLGHESMEGRTDAHFLRGQAQETMGEQECALESYLSAAAGDPSILDAWYAKGLLHRARSEFTEEVASYREALASAPEEVLPLYFLGQAYLLKGQFRRARGYLDRAVAGLLSAGEDGAGSSSDPLLAGPLLALHGALHLALGDPERGRASLEEALRIEGDAATGELFYDLALARFAAGEEDLARELLASHPALVKTPGLVLLDALLAGDPRESFEILTEGALELHPAPALHEALGNLAVAQEDLDRAVTHYTKALTLQEGLAPVSLVRNLAHLLGSRSEPLLALRAVAEVTGSSYRRFRSVLRGTPSHDNRALLLTDLERFGPAFALRWFGDRMPGVVAPDRPPYYSEGSG